VAYLLKARTTKPAETALLGNDSANTVLAREQIRNTEQWSKWETVFSTRSVLQLRDATIDELLGEVFSMRSLTRCYKQDI
jgi:hypothetical protein